MAGEVIRTIKRKEEEAGEIINAAHLEARRIVQEARDRKRELFREKDRLLEKEGEMIKARYDKETAGVLAQIEKEEREQIYRINAQYEKNLPAVVSYIIEHIVKE
jgi:vacuolar-type H+-ATPase subunit H